MDRSILSKRLLQFWKLSEGDRRELHSFVEALKLYGDAYVFGGFIRDVALGGGKSFKSDIDIVFDCHDDSGFKAFLSEYDLLTNKFGGHRLNMGRWPVDIWKYEDTWAFKEGLVKPTSPHSLLQTTYFNWDSALYDLQNYKLLSSRSYCEELRERKLDVVLSDNPNSNGAFIRSLRFLAKARAKTGYKLSNEILEGIHSWCSGDILQYEFDHFHSVALSENFLQNIKERSVHFDGEDWFQWCDQDDPRQLELFVEDSVAANRSNSSTICRMLRAAC